MTGGMEPIREFVTKISLVSDVIFPIASGMVPLRPLLDVSRNCRVVKHDNSLPLLLSLIGGGKCPAAFVGALIDPGFFFADAPG